MKTAAIYARVSSDKQREENTIASQTAALVAFARAEQFEVPKEWVFEDDGYSGANLIRPGHMPSAPGSMPARFRAIPSEPASLRLRQARARQSSR